MILLVVVFLTVRDVFDRLEKIERYPAKSLSHSVPMMRYFFLFHFARGNFCSPGWAAGNSHPSFSGFLSYGDNTIGIWGGGVVNKAVKKDSLTVNIL